MCGLSLMEKDIRHVHSAIEDLAFMNCSSRESDKVGRRVCIEYGCTKGREIRLIRGTEAGVLEVGNIHAELRSRREGR